MSVQIFNKFDVFSFVLLVLLFYMIYNVLKYLIKNKQIINYNKKHQIDIKSNCKVIAHRGSRCEGLPENTLAAFIDAINHGADVIELDVWLSLDSQVIIHHDKDFHRMTNSQCNSLVTSLNYNDYPLLSPSNDNQLHRSHLYPKDFTTRVPLLSEVLDVLTNNYQPKDKSINLSNYLIKRDNTFCGNKEVCLIIEFKQRSLNLINTVIDLLIKKGNDFITRVYMFSLDEQTNHMLRSINRININTICSITEMLRVLICYSLGFLSFIKLKDQAFGVSINEVTLEDVRKESAIKSLPDFIKVFLSYLLVGKPPYLMNAPGLFKQLRDSGSPVWFLGVNDVKDVSIAIEAGVTAVLTDKPTWLINYLNDNKIKFQQVQSIKQSIRVN